MHNHLRALAVFAKVAEAGSFRGAARSLGLSASVVSHHVTALERHLDTPLIYRTTRKLSLTDAGTRLAVSAQAMVNIAQDGFEEIGQSSVNPTGRLKITAPAILQYARFVKRISTFVKHFPKIEIEMVFTDRQSNIVEEGFDIAFRVGQLSDSSLIARKLAEGRLMLCAAPQYLQDNGPVTEPVDLEQLEIIALSSVGNTVRLERSGADPEPFEAQIPNRITVDSGFAARRLAIDNCGMVLLPDFFVQQALDDGALRVVLPGWQARTFGIFAVWPPNTGTNHLRNQFLKSVETIAKTGPETDGDIRPS